MIGFAVNAPNVPHSRNIFWVDQADMIDVGLPPLSWAAFEGARPCHHRRIFRDAGNHSAV